MIYFLIMSIIDCPAGSELKKRFLPSSLVSNETNSHNSVNDIQFCQFRNNFFSKSMTNRIWLCQHSKSGGCYIGTRTLLKREKGGPHSTRAFLQAISGGCYIGTRSLLKREKEGPHPTRAFIQAILELVHSSNDGQRETSSGSGLSTSYTKTTWMDRNRSMPSEQDFTSRKQKQRWI